ncbi:MAG: hypothetical protein HY978_00675 [Candidatus Liptonbacteria bacterium]|nr:hypothetical protein [Candidatus Liptonbacteria bacterium]
MRIVTPFFMVVVCLAVAHMALAIGIGVTPAELEVDVSLTDGGSTQMVIQNPSAEVTIFRVVPEDYEDNIKINPASFILPAGAQEKVTVRVMPIKAGRYFTQLAVTGRALADDSFAAAGGVRVPLRFTVREDSSLPWAARVLDYLDVYGYFWGAALVFLGLGLRLTRRYWRG